MSLAKQIKIRALNCTSPTQGFEVCPVDVASGVEFQAPASHETNLVRFQPGTIEELFVHHFQTDQLMVVKGKAVLVVLQDGKYQYILMSDRDPKVVTIPPGIPHSTVNLSSEPCVGINSVIRHGPPYERDYRPLKRRLPYDMDAIRKLFAD